jgi:hypothetical protein
MQGTGGGDQSSLFYIGDCGLHVRARSFYQQDPLPLGMVFRAMTCRAMTCRARICGKEG